MSAIFFQKQNKLILDIGYSTCRLKTVTIAHNVAIVSWLNIPQKNIVQRPPVAQFYFRRCAIASSIGPDQGFYGYLNEQLLECEEPLS